MVEPIKLILVPTEPLPHFVGGGIPGRSTEVAVSPVLRRFYGAVGAWMSATAAVDLNLNINSHHQCLRCWFCKVDFNVSDVGFRKSILNQFPLAVLELSGKLEVVAVSLVDTATVSIHHLSEPAYLYTRTSNIVCRLPMSTVMSTLFVGSGSGIMNHMTGRPMTHR